MKTMQLIQHTTQPWWCKDAAGRTVAAGTATIVSTVKVGFYIKYIAKLNPKLLKPA